MLDWAPSGVLGAERSPDRHSQVPPTPGPALLLCLPPVMDGLWGMMNRLLSGPQHILIWDSAIRREQQHHHHPALYFKMQLRLETKRSLTHCITRLRGNNVCKCWCEVVALNDGSWTEILGWKKIDRAIQFQPREITNTFNPLFVETIPLQRLILTTKKVPTSHLHYTLHALTRQPVWCPSLCNATCMMRQQYWNCRRNQESSIDSAYSETCS